MLEKALLGLAFAFVLLTLYFVIGWFVPTGTVVESVALPIDHRLPFVPATSWYYLPFFPVSLVLTLTLLEDRPQTYRTLGAMGAAQLCNFALWLTIPVAYPRPPLGGSGSWRGRCPIPSGRSPGTCGVARSWASSTGSTRPAARSRRAT